MTPQIAQTSTASSPAAPLPGSAPTTAAVAAEPPAPWIVPTGISAGGVEWQPRTRAHRTI